MTLKIRILALISLLFISSSAFAIPVYNLAVGSEIQLGDHPELVVLAASDKFDAGIFNLRFYKPLELNTDFRGSKMLPQGLLVFQESAAKNMKTIVSLETIYRFPLNTRK